MSALAMHAALLGTSDNPYLDGLGVQPKSVWSLRKMISSATLAMRVRRSSDNNEQDIGFDGDGLDETSLTAFVGSANGYVTKFYDQTTHGLHAINTNASSQPQTVSSGTILSGLTFDGSDDALWCNSYPFSQAQVGAYFKIKQDASSVRIILETTTNFNANDRTLAFYVESSTYAMGMNNAGANSQKINYQGLDTSAGLTQVSLVYSRAASGNQETRAYQAGSLATVTNVPPYTNEQDGTFNPNNLYIGARAASSLFMNGVIETLVIYDGSTTAIRESIEAIVA